ncbi:hypothetical protein J5491_03520 [Candidatus Saccharibacteria bacterium]|nr:hypothetical protein [Candidatus Saccharibacteria bacterium]
MTFNAMHLYAEVYPEFQDSFATSIKKLSNEEYESFIGLTNHEIEVLKNLLSNRLDSRDRAIVYRRFGLEDGEMKALETIGKELFVSTYKIREALARNYRFFRRENILPPICSAPKSVNETAKKFADELKEIRRDPIFEKERYLTSELQSFLRTTPFRCSREYYEVAGLELSLCDTPIDKLELSIRSHNCLKRAMLFTIDDLLRMSPKDLMGVRNLGRKGVEEVLEKLRPYRS